MNGLKIMFAHRWRRINERLENYPLHEFVERVYFFKK